MECSPARRRRPSAAQAALELGAHAWLGHLRRKSDAHVFLHVGVQVGLSRAYEQSLSGPPAVP
eukprot:11344096-Alexandrium_andersonii.AAC.1